LVAMGARYLTCRLTGEHTWHHEVGYCTTNGVDLNRAIIERGFALACPRYDARYVRNRRRRWRSSTGRPTASGADPAILNSGG
jgi:hypothetical protein